MVHPRLVQIPAEHIETVWVLAAPVLQRVVDGGGDISVEAFRSSLIERERQLWFVWSDDLEAVFITQLVFTPHGKVANIDALAGENLANWIGLIEGVEDWARAEGCVKVEIVGRRGWSRVLPEYDIAQYVLEKRL